MWGALLLVAFCLADSASCGAAADGSFREKRQASCANGVTVLSAVSGTIASGTYWANSNCQWLIEVPGAKSVTLTIREFSSENGHDWLTVYNASWAIADKRLRRMSGVWTASQLADAGAPRSGSAMFVVWTTDSSGLSNGFRASYTAETNGGGSSSIDIEYNGPPITSDETQFAFAMVFFALAGVCLVLCFFCWLFVCRCLPCPRPNFSTAGSYLRGQTLPGVVLEAPIEALADKYIELLITVGKLVCVSNNPGSYHVVAKASYEQLKIVFKMRSHELTCAGCDGVLQTNYVWVGDSLLSCPKCGTSNNMPVRAAMPNLKRRPRLAGRLCDRRSFLKAAQARYNRWLYLKQKNPGVALAMPIDVQFMATVHMLHPVRYGQMCQALFGRLEDVTLGVSIASESNTKALWDAEFASGTSGGVAVPVVPKSVNGLIPSAIGQARFLSKIHPRAVSLPEARAVFIAAARQQYHRFMQLMKIKRSMHVLVPTVQIDLAWHAHMTQPVAYASDCLSNLEYVLDHDDSIPDKKLKSHLKDTEAMWKTAFKTHYLRPNKDRWPRAKRVCCGIGLLFWAAAFTGGALVLMWSMLVLLPAAILPGLCCCLFIASARVQKHSAEQRTAATEAAAAECSASEPYAGPESSQCGGGGETTIDMADGQQQGGTEMDQTGPPDTNWDDDDTFGGGGGGQDGDKPADCGAAGGCGGYAGCGGGQPTSSCGGGGGGGGGGGWSFGGGDSGGGDSGGGGGGWDGGSGGGDSGGGGGSSCGGSSGGGSSCGGSSGGGSSCGGGGGSSCGGGGGSSSCGGGGGGGGGSSD